MHRRTQLAGAGAAALDRPRHVALVGHHLADVGPQRQPVDRDLLGRAPDEDEAGATGDGADDGQVEVGTAERVRRREPPRRQRVGDDHAVEVGPVAEGERQAVGAVEALELLHVVLIDQHVVRPQEPLTHPRPALGGPVVVGGGHLVEVALDLRPDLLLGSALLLGLLGDRALEALVVEQLGHLLRRCGRKALTHAPRKGGAGEVSGTSDDSHVSAPLLSACVVGEHRCAPKLPSRTLPDHGIGPAGGTGRRFLGGAGPPVGFRAVACPSGRRCNTRNVVWGHTHRGFKSHRHRQEVLTKFRTV